MVLKVSNTRTLRIDDRQIFRRGVLQGSRLDVIYTGGGAIARRGGFAVKFGKPLA